MLSKKNIHTFFLKENYTKIITYEAVEDEANIIINNYTQIFSSANCEEKCVKTRTIYSRIVKKLYRNMKHCMTLPLILYTYSSSWYIFFFSYIRTHALFCVVWDTYNIWIHTSIDERYNVCAHKWRRVCVCVFMCSDNGKAMELIIFTKKKKYM